MKTKLSRLILTLLVLSTLPAVAVTRYVDLNSPSPTPPYTNWSTAATNIQNAIDAAVAGDLVLVTNGIYNRGGRAIQGSMTNRVAVNKALAVQSVNGPEFTMIQGYQLPTTTNGNGAIRCVYLTNGATLSGFTLTNGATRAAGIVAEDSGGGIWCLLVVGAAPAVISNCVLVGNSAYLNGGGVANGTLYYCRLSGNSANWGGGASAGNLNNCTMEANTAFHGGGAAGGTLNSCTVRSNSATQDGGGVYSGTLNNCTLDGNSAPTGGGGAGGGVLNNCTLTNNSASQSGGGAAGCTLRSCRLSCNSSLGYGGGASGCTLNNCTLTGNTAKLGGGSYSGTLNNCIVYYNTATFWDANYFGGTLNFCCTSPLPDSGIGNISLDPLLTSASHLSIASPCRGAGGDSYSGGTDIDGELWGHPPSIGCDELAIGAATGALSVGIRTAFTTVAEGFSLEMVALIEGRSTASMWSFGDGLAVSNQPYTSHVWTSPGDYVVTLRAYNESFPSGISTNILVHVLAKPVHHVRVGSLTPLAPFYSWTTAAGTIQDAIDSASVPGALVLVTNGVYDSGGRVVNGTLTNRVVVNKLVTVQSVNGPPFTAIKGHRLSVTTNGDGAIRCVFLSGGAVLSGFTLTNGATRWVNQYLNVDSYGGGVWCESMSSVVSNCVFSANSAGIGGGGAYAGTLLNCILDGNSASQGGGIYNSIVSYCDLLANSAASGGGAYYARLRECMVVANKAQDGGGAYNGMVNNCILTSNLASQYGGGSYGSTLNGCVLSNNSAQSGGGSSYGILDKCVLSANSAQDGGGVFYGTLNNCNLTSNSASRNGGGVYGGVYNNSTLVGNSAIEKGGGAFGCYLNNCIVHFNNAPSGTNEYICTCNYTCTVPLPTNGFGNITNDPIFMSVNTADFRLQSVSPCVNAGRNTYSTNSLDLDGNPRIAGGTVDIGAYELQAPSSVLSYAWAQQNGLLTDGSEDFTDVDGDGLTNYGEWRSDTNPTNSTSVLRMVNATNSPSGAKVTWKSVATRNYWIERATNLAAPLAFQTVATNVAGVAGTKTYTDTSATNGGPYFYRVGVQ